MFWVLITVIRITDCGYSLKLPQRGNSNEYPQHILWRNQQTYPLLITKYPLYLFHCINPKIWLTSLQPYD